VRNFAPSIHSPLRALLKEVSDPALEAENRHTFEFKFCTERPSPLHLRQLLLLRQIFQREVRGAWCGRVPVSFSATCV